MDICDLQFSKRDNPKPCHGCESGGTLATIALSRRHALNPPFMSITHETWLRLQNGLSHRGILISDAFILLPRHAKISGISIECICSQD
jgi:hypothetical protein